MTKQEYIDECIKQGCSKEFIENYLEVNSWKMWEYRDERIYTARDELLWNLECKYEEEVGLPVRETYTSYYDDDGWLECDENECGYTDDFMDFVIKELMNK